MSQRISSLQNEATEEPRFGTAVREMNDDDMLRARQMLAEVAHNDGEELTPEDSAVFASARENVDTETEGDYGGQ